MRGERRKKKEKTKRDRSMKSSRRMVLGID